ncbi:MAG TPA: hypothetical protein VFS21_00935 [Roseiflexaceae bacterium]|nr:hypothetical protein [Roseiflexaceae bacterium]
MPHMTNLVMTHEQVRERLPEYAAMVALGGAAPQPQDLAAHVRGCTSCREELEDLLALTGAAYEGRIPAAPAYPQPDLSCLGLRMSTAPEQPGVFDRLGRLVVSFSEALLASLQTPSLAGAMRGSLLCRYTQGGGPRNIDVTIEVFTEDSARERGRVQVMVDVPDSDPFDQSGSHVTLQADGRSWDAATDETGCASFAGVPLRALPRLRVEVVPKTT